MKMTRSEWRYLQKIALDHPYFDTHALPLTEKEAKTIVEANIGMTGKEFVDSIHAKLGMARPKEEKKRFAWLSNVGELLSVPPIRRIAIAVLVIVLMTVFFAATPTGRAIAESAIKYMATLFDDGRLVADRNDEKSATIPLDTDPDSGEGKGVEPENDTAYQMISINTFEEFTAVTDVRPKILPYPYVKLSYYYDGCSDLLQLYAKYETPKGIIVTYQIWNTMNFTGTSSTGFKVYDKDPSVYYSLEDGSLTVIKFYDDFVLTIVAEDSITVDELLGLIPLE